MGRLAAPLLSAESTYRSIAAGFGSPTTVAGIVCAEEGTEVVGFGFPSVTEKVGAMEGPGSDSQQVGPALYERNIPMFVLVSAYKSIGVGFEFCASSGPETACTIDGPGTENLVSI